MKHGFNPPIVGTTESGEVIRFRGAKHARVDNSRLRAIPSRSRTLSIYCSAGRRTVFAVTTLAGGRDVLLIGASWTYTRGAAWVPESYPCRCGSGHTLDVDRVWVHVDRLRHAAPKLREVDVSECRVLGELG